MKLYKKTVFHYGCSFAENIGGFSSDLFDGFEYINMGKQSSNNKLILETFKKNSTKDSISIIQWSSLTRPGDNNHSDNDNILYGLLDEWYVFIENAMEFANENNIKLIQYIGWAIWKDDELNDYHRNKLKSYNINWFSSSSQLDLWPSNCFQFQSPDKWSSIETKEGLFQWDVLQWGGMSEWIRENIDIYNRYMGKNIYGDFDVHPSKVATNEFTKQVLLPLLSE
jgi:hypothetical protein